MDTASKPNHKSEYVFIVAMDREEGILGNENDTPGNEKVTINDLPVEILDLILDIDIGRVHNYFCTPPMLFQKVLWMLVCKTWYELIAATLAPERIGYKIFLWSPPNMIPYFSRLNAVMWCVENHHFDLFRRLLCTGEHGHCAPKLAGVLPEIEDKAAECDNVRILQWCKGRGYSLKKRRLTLRAIQAGSIRVLDWLEDNRMIRCTEGECRYAADGKLEPLQWYWPRYHS